MRRAIPAWPRERGLGAEMARAWVPEVFPFQWELAQILLERMWGRCWEGLESIRSLEVLPVRVEALESLLQSSLVLEQP